MRSTLADVRWLVEQLPFHANVIELADFVAVEADYQDAQGWYNFILEHGSDKVVADLIDGRSVQVIYHVGRDGCVVMIPKRRDG